MSRTRNLVGYADSPPHPNWPNGSRIALQIVINYEEGAERSVEHGDVGPETLNSDNPAPSGRPGHRDFVTESHYDYGARVGYWRLMRIFDSRKLPVTVFAVAEAIAKNPAVGRHLAQSQHEVCCHGLRWIDYGDVPEHVEREHMRNAYLLLEQTTGKKITGWYTGRISAHSRRLAALHGGLVYDSDAYDDDLPYWVTERDKPWLVIPYSFDNNDMRYASSPGFDTPDDFFNHLKANFDALYDEGETSPKMMSVGLHCRLSGKPGRAAAVARFIDYALAHEDVWICRRSDIARHWISTQTSEKRPGNPVKIANSQAS